MNVEKKLNKTKLVRYGMLLVAALFWGMAFVVQATDKIPPLTFTAVRAFIGAAVLFPVAAAINALKKKRGEALPPSPEEKKKNFKTLILGGLCCGAVLTCATNLQQIGMSMNLEAGKAGFITAMYIVLVPVIGLFTGKKSGLVMWISVLIAAAGLYFICVKGAFKINAGDLCLIACAFAFAGHIAVVDRFTNRTDGVKLSATQFLFCGSFSLVAALIFEWGRISISELLSFYPAFLYMGICSCGIAYTFQIVGQKGTNPTAASLIMSFESCFSLVGGAIFLGERLTAREWIGFALMLVAVFLTETKELFEKTPTQAKGETPLETQVRPRIETSIEAQSETPENEPSETQIDAPAEAKSE